MPTCKKCLYYNHFDTRLSLVLMSTNMQVSTAKAISHYKDKQQFTETPKWRKKDRILAANMAKYPLIHCRLGR